MDSPERSTAGGTPISKFEDSPFYNFVNSLSPIQPIKSGHSIQAFHSPSFAAISSVFSSPHVSLQKESRFLIRQPFPDSVKEDAFSDSLDENNRPSGIPIGDVLSTCKVLAQENANMTCSLNKATIDPADESSTQSHFSQPVQFDNGSPNHNTTPCYTIKLDFKLDVTCAPSTLVELVQAEDGVDGPKNSLTEIGRNVESHEDQIKEDVSGNEWKNLISDNSDDLLNFDANGSEAGKIQEKDHIISLKSQSGASYGLCVQNVLVDSFMDDIDAGDENRMHRTPKLLSDTCQNQEILNEQNQETEFGLNDCVLGSKVDSQQHRGVRRRCLVFEVAGVSKKNLLSNLNVPPSIKLPTNDSASDDRQLISSNSLKAPVPRILPGIGLHLNALATTKDKPTSDKTKVLGREFISRPCSVRPVAPVTAGEKDPKKLLKLNQNQDGTRNDAQDHHVVQSDVPPTPKPGVEESTSPKKKRRKTENGGEIDGCKRCNCKKSKCLKLYCECFAAGVYCVEPCSCQGCLNKPIHEETVLGTRKQIESRNPLAFAPKVIRTSDHEQEMGEESNKTPASARHKRGCNCKKSNCLKKYCECFQGGVGCSFSCRCEGCKNAFGRKDGSEEIDYDEELDACENSRLKPDDGKEIVEVPDGELNHLSESTFPFTPFPICSSSVKFPFLSSGKPPRSSTLSQMNRAEIPQIQCKDENNIQAVQDDDTPEILGGNPSPCTLVKTASPNGKRVSLPLNGLGMSPNFKGGRKLILKSIPSFPTLSSETSSSTHLSSSALT